MILTGVFNINILNRDSDKDIADFVDTTYASSLQPFINTPSRITAHSKNLIDNKFTKKITAGNIATSISDHQTQFLIIRDQTTSFEDKRKIRSPKNSQI